MMKRFVEIRNLFCFSIVERNDAAFGSKNGQLLWHVSGIRCSAAQLYQ